MLREGLAIREKKLPAGAWQIANTRSLLGAALAKQGRFAEAEPLLVAAHDGLVKAKNTPAVRLSDAVERIIDLYEKWGMPDQAEEWRKKRPKPGK